jgi:hypothetical protein
MRDSAPALPTRGCPEALPEIAIVPESECSTPTLIGDLSCAKTEAPGTAERSAVPAAALINERRELSIERVPK